MILEELVKSKLNELAYLNLIITGGTCSGKTTEAKRLEEIFNTIVSQVPQDNYFKDLKDIPKNRNGYLMDSPNAFYIDEYIQDVRQFLSIGQIAIPNYDISKNKRINKNLVIKSGRINIFEGLHTISLLNNLENKLTIFIDTPTQVCLERRIKRDKTNYGIDDDAVRKYFESCILPLSKTYINPQKDKADVIIEEGGKILCR